MNSALWCIRWFCLSRPRRSPWWLLFAHRPGHRSRCRTGRHVLLDGGLLERLVAAVQLVGRDLRPGQCRYRLYRQRRDRDHHHDGQRLWNLPSATPRGADMCRYRRWPLRAGPVSWRFGTGSFTQSGGTNTCTSYSYLGFKPGVSGTYTLSGSGQLFFTNGPLVVGFSGTGNFTESGGTSTCNKGFIVGNASRHKRDVHTQLGATHRTGPYLGYSGTGYFVQSGGTSTCRPATTEPLISATTLARAEPTRSTGGESLEAPRAPQVAWATSTLATGHRELHPIGRN